MPPRPAPEGAVLQQGPLVAGRQAGGDAAVAQLSRVAAARTAQAILCHRSGEGTVGE